MARNGTGSGASDARTPKKSSPSAKRRDDLKPEAHATEAPSPEEAADFLERLRPGGPWLLTAIIPDGPTKTITAHNADEVLAFVAEYDGKRNLYYSVNPTRGEMTKKAAKTDIARIEYLLADLDPNEGEKSEDAKKRYLEALEPCKPPPTAVINSGNGINGLWKLSEPIDISQYEPIWEPPKGKEKKGKWVLAPEALQVAADAEGRSKALMQRLGCGDTSTFNIDRILRLPGTTNLPNKKKISEGKVECQSTLIRFNGAASPLDAFPEPEPEDTGTAKPNGAATGIDALPISKRMKDLIRGIHDPAHPYGKTGKGRSEASLAVQIAMAGAGCTDDQFEAIFLDPQYPIAAHTLDQPKPSETLAKHIKKARKLAVDPEIEKLNENYALVLVGDKAAVMRTSTEGLKLLTVAAFKQWLANRFITYQDKRMPLAEYWLHHPQRRQYEGIVFAPQRDVPDHYNLYRGFSVEPKKGDCSKFLAHLKDNVCSGKEDLYQWVVGWFAQIVQCPDLKMGTSLVLRGKQGVGKTKVGEVIGSLFKDHYALVADPRFVTGRFNSHLVSCLLLHCDEAFWAGDHAAEGKLKDLITGSHQFIELKGKEAIRVQNFVRLFVTGNPDWVILRGFRERCFGVLDVAEDHMQDLPYFAAIDAEMDNGNREALLYFLLHFDLQKKCSCVR